MSTPIFSPKDLGFFQLTHISRGEKADFHCLWYGHSRPFHEAGRTGPVVGTQIECPLLGADGRFLAREMPETVTMLAAEAWSNLLDTLTGKIIFALSQGLKLAGNV